MANESPTYICKVCGRGPFKGHMTICNSCKRKYDHLGPNGEKIKICPKCGKEHTKIRTIFCSKECGASRQFSVETKKLKSRKYNEYFNSPEGIATNEKRRKVRTALNKKEDLNLVDQEEFLVEPPDPRTIEDYDNYLDGYNHGGNW